MALNKNLITDKNLGAWLIKCDPKTWDFTRALEDGLPSIAGWSVSDNYRSLMMREGQPVIFWVSGPAPKFPIAGVWGLGTLAGPRYWEEASDPDEHSYWLDPARGAKAGYSIPTDIRLFTSAAIRHRVSRESIKKNRILSKMEVMRAPQASNPSFLTKAEYAALRKLIPSAPQVLSGKRQIITVSKTGAGFGNWETNRLVELAAMEAVEKYYVQKGYKVVDVSSSKVGWDLEIRKKGTKGTLLIEVKGVSGSEANVLLTRNEMKRSAERPDWKLAVVTQALTKKPRISVWTAEEVNAAAKPFAWEVNLR